MSQQTFLGLPMDFFAQQPGQNGKVEFKQPPKAEELSVDAQNMIDAFSDANTQNWNLMAKMLKEGKFENFGRIMNKLVTEWEEAGR